MAGNVSTLRSVSDTYCKGDAATCSCFEHVVLRTQVKPFAEQPQPTEHKGTWKFERERAAGGREKLIKQRMAKLRAAKAAKNPKPAPVAAPAPAAKPAAPTPPRPTQDPPAATPPRRTPKEQDDHDLAAMADHRPPVVLATCKLCPNKLDELSTRAGLTRCDPCRDKLRVSASRQQNPPSPTRVVDNCVDCGEPLVEKFAGERRLIRCAKCRKKNMEADREKRGRVARGEDGRAFNPGGASPSQQARANRKNYAS